MRLDCCKIYASPEHTSALLKRNAIGLVVHVILWSVVLYLGDLIRLDRRLGLTVLAVWLTVSAARTAQAKLSPRLQQHRPRLNYGLYVLGVWVTAGVWGSVLCLAVQRPDLNSIANSVLVICAGVGAGGVAATSPDRLVAAGFVTIMMVPPAFFMFAAGYPDPGMPLLVLTYTVYLILLSNRYNQEYWTAVAQEVALRERTDELARLNTVDFLTGLYNRRHFESVLELEVKRASRSGSPLSLLVLDVDRFKSINDSYGHPAGDRCLRRCAEALRETAKRDTDVVARIGGEEFAIILPETSQDAAFLLAERIRSAVGAVRVSEGGDEVGLTVSVGLTCREVRPEDSGAEMLADADAALYLAKRSGRDQVQAILRRTARVVEPAAALRAAVAPSAGEEREPGTHPGDPRRVSSRSE